MKKWYKYRLNENWPLALWVGCIFILLTGSLHTHAAIIQNGTFENPGFEQVNTNVWSLEKGASIVDHGAKFGGRTLHLVSTSAGHNTSVSQQRIPIKPG